MSVDSAETTKNTWSAIFRRRGANGIYTRLFDELEPTERDELSTHIRLRTAELPVIGGIQNTNNWFVLTTERLVWSLGGVRNELALEVIRDVTADLDELRYSEQAKLDMDKLQIRTMTNEIHLIRLEPGQPLSGTWHVLKNIGARNRNTLDSKPDGRNIPRQPH